MSQDRNRPLPGFNYFVICWCREGLECVIDIGEMSREQENLEQENLARILCDQAPHRLGDQIGQTVGHLKMRARVNGHRAYEIYAIRCYDTVTRQDWLDMFEADPQSAADLVRERGEELYSDRAMFSQKPKIS